MCAVVSFLDTQWNQYIDDLNFCSEIQQTSMAHIYLIPTNNLNVVRNQIFYQFKLSLLIRVRKKSHKSLKQRKRYLKI